MTNSCNNKYDVLKQCSGTAKGAGLLTIVLLIAGIFFASDLQFSQSSPSNNRPLEVTIEILPANDIIYKIPGDLNFENWNFGFLVKGLYSISRIDSL